MIRVTPARTRQLSHPARFVRCTSDRSRFLIAANDGRYTVLDAELTVAHQGVLPSTAGSVDLHPTRDVFALASTTELVAATFAGEILYRRKHRPWKSWEGGAVAFLGDGSRLLAVCPADGDAVDVLVLQSDDGKVLAEQALTVPESSVFHLLRHPLRERWGLWAGAGQDGQWTYWVSADETQVSIEEVRGLTGNDHGPAEFGPSGKEFLVSAGGGLERYTFPDAQRTGCVDRPDDRDFSFESVCYLGPERALISDGTSSRVHTVDLASMEIEDEVAIEGHGPVPFAELYPAARTGRDELCTDLWYFQSLPRAGVLTIHGAATDPHTITLLEGAPLFSTSP